MSGITPAMRECLDAILDMTVDGVPPTYLMLQDRLGIASKSGVHRMIRSLEERGLVNRLPGKARSLAVIERRGSNDLGSESTAELVRMRDRIDAILVARAAR